MKLSNTYLITSLILGIFLSSLIWFVDYKSSSAVAKEIPLLKLGDQVKNLTTTSHLWFEEHLTGDSTVNFNEDIIDKVEKVKTLLKGFIKDEKYPGIILDNLKNIQSDVIKYESTLLKRKALFDKYGNEIAGTELDVEFDAHFTSAIKYSDQLVELSNINLSHSIDRSSKYTVIIILIVLATFITKGILLRKAQAKDEKAKEILESEVERIELIGNFINDIANENYHGSVPFDPKKDELGRMLVVMRDKLLDTILNLQHKNEELNKFAHVASHDLKSPLRAISTIVDFIEDDLEGYELPTEVRDNFKIIKHRVKFMNNLINDIISYSQAEVDKDSKESIDLDLLCNEIKGNINTRNKDVEFTIDKHVKQFHFNKTKLYQVLANIIDNAIKYNDKEKIIVSLSINKENENLTFCVEDNGPGIPKEFRNKVLEMFQTLEKSKTTESTGIGLSIANKIINQAKGTITISESKALGGACFSIKLPIK